jgi:hypothetical protein
MAFERRSASRKRLKPIAASAQSAHQKYDQDNQQDQTNSAAANHGSAEIKASAAEQEQQND